MSQARKPFFGYDVDQQTVTIMDLSRTPPGIVVMTIEEASYVADQFNTLLSRLRNQVLCETEDPPLKGQDAG